jgi:cytoskeletal protein RodZ
MKKTFDLFMIIILVVAIIILSSCTQALEKETTKNTEDETTENLEQDNGDDLISEQEEPTEPNTQQPNTEETVSILPVIEYETITETGRFSGYPDDSHIAILISGVPESIAEKNFLIDENIRDKIDEINPDEETVFKFEYYTDENGENVIVEITKI